MKKFKLLSSIVAVAAISCVAAASSMAADALELKLDAAKSTADSKVINVYYTGDTLHTVNSFTQILFNVTGADVNEIDAAFSCSGSPSGSVSGTQYKISHTGNPKAAITADADGNFLLATLTVPASADLSIDIPAAVVQGYKTGTVSTNGTLKPSTAGFAYNDNLAVINAENVGLFTEGEGDPAKAYKATAAGEGVITWNVTDGTNVATATGTTLTGGAEVVAGLVVTGANVDKLTYAAVTID